MPVVTSPNITINAANSGITALSVVTGLVSISDGASVSNGLSVLNSGITLSAITTPSAPGLNKTRVYSKSDGKLYFRSGASGNEITLADTTNLAASAFTDTTNAGNITSGTISANRLPGVIPTLTVTNLIANISQNYTNFTQVNTQNLRIRIGVDSSAESGLNAGSNFYINAYADDGSTLIATALTVVRSTGYVSAPGRIGIGTTSPSTKLDITTATSLDGLNITDGTRWFKLMSGTVGSGSYNGMVSANDIALIYSGGTTGTGNFVIAPWASATSGLRMNGSGEIGFSGQPTSGYKIDVAGVAGVTGYLSIAPSGTAKDNAYNGGLIITKPAASGQHINLIRSGNYAWSLGFVYNTNTFGIGNGQATDSSFTAPSFTMNTAGQVGIQTVSPAQHLTLNAASGVNRLIQFSQSDTAKAYVGLGTDNVLRIQTIDTASVRFATQSTDRVIIDSSGNMGIATTSPNSRLEVNDGYITVTRFGQDASLITRRAEGTVASPANTTAIDTRAMAIAPYVYNTSYNLIGLIEAWTDGSITSTSFPGRLMFSTTPSGSTSPLERMRIDSAGNVMIKTGNFGIGVTNPGAKLDVAGVLRLNGTTSGANYTQLQSAATPTTNVTYTLPDSAPSVTGAILTSSTSGVMSWSTSLTSLSVSGSLSVTQNLSVTGDVNISGNINVAGTFTTYNSVVTTIENPTVDIGGGLGGSAPTLDDGYDKGITFQWHNGTSAKNGFFGFDRSTQYWTYIPDATVTNGMVSGTPGSLASSGVVLTNAASAPSAPGAGLTSLYSKSGEIYYRSGASGAETSVATTGKAIAMAIVFG